MKSKYGIFLNILLILLAILAVGIIGYIAYDHISHYILTKEAEEAANLFESQFVGINNDGGEHQNVIVVDIENNQATDNQSTETPITNTAAPNTIINVAGAKYKGYEVVGSIQIPKTNIKYPVVDTIEPYAIAVAVTAIYGPGLNEVGNTVLVAHNYRNGTFFSNNKKLAVGDKIYITDSIGREVEYTIYNTYLTSDTDFSYATRNTGGKREISLSTCTNESSKRLVIWAKE